MSDRQILLGARILAYRAVPGTPGGFIASNPTFFDKLPNAIEIKDLRIKFHIEKSILKDPNTLEVTISNCNEQTRGDLTTRPLIVRIDAGYDGNLRHIFTGDLRYGYSKLDGTTWQTVLTLADGDRAYRHARVNFSYTRGTPILTALKACAKSMQMELDGRILATPELQQQFVSGRVLNGPTERELTDILAPFGFHWSMQDGRIQILRDEETRADQAYVISPQTGMRGSPEFSVPDKAGKPPKLQINHSLYPELTPGGKIEVRSRAINGIFRMERVIHDGDTRGKGTTQIEAKAL